MWRYHYCWSEVDGIHVDSGLSLNDVVERIEQDDGWEEAEQAREFLSALAIGGLWKPGVISGAVIRQS